MKEISEIKKAIKEINQHNMSKEKISRTKFLQKEATALKIPSNVDTLNTVSFYHARSFIKNSNKIDKAIKEKKVKNILKYIGKIDYHFLSFMTFAKIRKYAIKNDPSISKFPNFFLNEFTKITKLMHKHRKNMLKNILSFLGDCNRQEHMISDRTILDKKKSDDNIYVAGFTEKEHDKKKSDRKKKPATKKKSAKKKSDKRCPRGYRKNKKNGECVKYTKQKQK